MSPDLKECEAQALKLNPKESAALAMHLIASLDALDDSENKRLRCCHAGLGFEQERMKIYGAAVFLIASIKGIRYYETGYFDPCL